MANMKKTKQTLITNQKIPTVISVRGSVMISDVDILRAAQLMMHRYWGDAELDAAKYADLMRGCGDQDGLVAWAKIWRMIAVMHPTPTGLPH